MICFPLSHSFFFLFCSPIIFMTFDDDLLTTTNYHVRFDYTFVWAFIPLISVSLLNVCALFACHIHETDMCAILQRIAIECKGMNVYL